MPITLVRYSKYYHFCLEGGAGLNPTLFPADDNTHYVRSGFVHDIGLGNYIIEINPIDDADGGYLAQRFWDLYYSGAKKNEGENIDLGNFEFLTKEFIVNSDGGTVNFSDLYLDWTLYNLGSNIALPAIIPHPSVEFARVNMDAPGVFIENVTTSGFDISRITGWTHDDVKVQLLIKGG